MDQNHPSIIVWTESDGENQIRHIVHHDNINRFVDDMTLGTFISGDAKGYLSIGTDSMLVIKENGHLDAISTDDDNDCQINEVNLALSKSDLFHLWRWLDANKALFMEVQP